MAPRRMSVVVLWALGAVAISGDLVWLWTGSRADPAPWYMTMPVAVTFLLSAAIIVLRCVRMPYQRGPWLLVAASTALYALGYLVYDLVSLASTVPTASLADIFWFPTLPLVIGAVWAMARPQVGRVRKAVYVGAVAVALLAAAIVAAILGPDVLGWSSDGFLDSLVNLYYPAVDMLLVGSVSAILSLSGRLDRTWGLIGGATVLFVVADATFARVIAAGGDGYERIDPIWAIGGLLLAAAAWQRPRPVTHRLLSLPELAAPLAAAVVAVGLLTFGPLFDWDPVAIVLAAVGALAALLRLALGVHALLDAAEYHQLAITDDLTGLHNRRGFLVGVQEEFERHHRGAHPRAILLLDIDRFKEINDGLGHQTGDKVLAAVAKRLTDTLPPGDLLGRLGGDEFAVLTHIPVEGGVEVVVERLLVAVRQPLPVGQLAFPIDVTIGVAVESDALAERPDAMALELLRCADSALYQAKDDHIEWARYDGIGPDRQRDALELAAQLRALLTAAPGTDTTELGWLELYYQPLVAVAGHSGQRSEALVRWIHPRYGMVPPDRFVALAERTGLTTRLTRQVLTMALDQAATWRAAGAPAVVSVNLSASDLDSTTLVDEVLGGLSERGLPTDALIVEITERVAVSDLDNGRDALATLRRAGVGVAIDDFGTGYSALSYLQRLPATELKLDRSLTMKVVDDPGAVAIAQACIDLAHTLGLEVVAEGVETAEQAVVLTERGCEWLQGWLYGRPTPPGPLPPAPAVAAEALPRLHV